jgi:hypothetical protein
MVLYFLREMANQPYMFTLDEQAIAVIREVKKQKRSQFVRDAILAKAKALDSQPEIPKARVKISI